jgi:DNA-binding CsgD family transcriptional regulator
VDSSLVHNLWPQVMNSPFAGLVHTLSPEKAYHGATVMPPRALLGMDFYHYAVKPMEGLHSMLGMPFRTRDAYSFATACRAPRKGAFGQSNLTAMQTLLPHLRNALRLGQRLRQAESDAWHRDTALDRLDIGVVVMDRQRRPLLVNARARALVGLNDGLRLTQDRFSAADGAANRELQSALEGGADTTELASRSLCVRVNRPSGRPPFLLRIVPIAGDGEVSAAHPRGAALLFIDTVEADRLRPATLRRWFRLSAREAELATLLIDGHSLADCASAMRVSIETIRTHLDGLFAKTRTRRQVELVSALLRAAWRL